MAIVQILGNAFLPESGVDGNLVAQPSTPLRSITGYYPPMSALDTSTVVGAGKYVNQPPPTDPCARIAYLQGMGAKLDPTRAKALTTACREARGIAPTQTARYQPQTGEITAIDATTGESVTMDAVTGQQIDPLTGLPIKPWYMRPTTWLIGGAVVVGAVLLLK